MKLTDFKMLTFDTYGTLIDWESGIYEALAPLLDKLPIRLERDEVLELFAECEMRQHSCSSFLRQRSEPGVLPAAVFDSDVERHGTVEQAGASPAPRRARVAALANSPRRPGVTTPAAIDWA